MNQYKQKGEYFLKECLFDGLAHSYDVVSKKYVKPYPEVTGYLLSYFCQRQEAESNLTEAGEKLLELQDSKEGGWASFYDLHNLYTFDTAQIVIGLCCLYEKTKDTRYMDAAIRGGNFLIRMQREDGAFYPVYDIRTQKKVCDCSIYDIWNGPFSGLMCKLTEVYQKMADVTGEQKYIERKRKTAEFYSKAEYIECTHPMGYWLEGLYCAENYEFVEQILTNNVIPRIRENGYIPYQEDLPYAYVSGTIQLGIILEKMGHRQYSLMIREYARKVQGNHECGGIFQYADEQGNLDRHIHTEINSWGTKYFCELEELLEQDN